MYTLNISYKQPWFDPVHLLRNYEEKALRIYFESLEANVSRLMTAEPDVYETSLTTGLVQSIKGIDSIAKAQLEHQLTGTDLDIRMSARELRSHSGAAGELLDFIIELTISSGNLELLHHGLLLEGKRLYSQGGLFTSDSRFKELNRREVGKGGKSRVRSAVQTKTMMELQCRAGVFALYCPLRIGRTRAGIRILFPETVCMLPRQPTIRQVFGDTLAFPDFMIRHFFTGRRGIPFVSPGLKSIVSGDPGSVSARYHWRIEVRLPKDRMPELDRRFS